jgi:hypothetical protein
MRTTENGSFGLDRIEEIDGKAVSSGQGEPRRPLPTTLVAVEPQID